MPQLYTLLSIILAITLSSCMEDQTTLSSIQNLNTAEGSASCKNITSYYWPLDVTLNNDINSWAIKNVSTVDILNDVEHGDIESRNYWRNMGVNLASRVYPFRFSNDIEDNVVYFESNITIDKLIAIDELVSHNWSELKKSNFLELIRQFKSRNPDVRIILWDASIWGAEEFQYARTIYSEVDLILVQHYADDDTNFYQHIQDLKAKIDKYVTNLIPRKKLGIAIGVRPGESEISLDGNTTIPEDFLYDTAYFLDGENINNIALYAPIYFSTRTLEKLDTLYSQPIYEDCNFFKTITTVN